MKFLFRVLNEDGTDVKLNPESERLEVGTTADTLDLAVAKTNEFLRNELKLEGQYLLHITDGNDLQKSLMAEL